MFELILIVLVVFILYRLASKSPNSIGERGERKVRNEINKLANNEEGIQIFNDVVLEAPDGTTQIDHIILSHFGIFVLETKNYKGWIFGSPRQKQWTQTLYGKKYKFQNPLHQNYKHVKAVQHLLNIKQSIIHSIVVFSGEAVIKTETPGNVLYLRDLLTYIYSYQAAVLGDREIEKYSEILRNPLHSDPDRKKDHIRQISNNLGNDKVQKSFSFTRLLLYVFGAFFLFSIFIGNDQEPTSSSGPHFLGAATVTARSLRVRSDPTSNSDVINQLKKGDMVEIKENYGDWSLILSGSVEGWVSNKYLSKK